MKILYITQYFSSVGGGEVVFYYLAKGMASRGHDVDVVSHKLRNNTGYNLEVGNLNVYRIKPTLNDLPPPSMKEHGLFIMHATIKCSKIIKERGINLIHANNLTPIIIGSMLSKIHSIPLVVTIHDIFSTSSPNHWKEWTRQNNTSRLNSIIAPIFEKVTVKMPCDAIHTVSNATKSDLLHYGNKSNVTVIPNGIDIKSYSNTQNAYERYVIFLGRFVFYKNLNIVIESFKEVIERIPDARLIAVGDGPMRNSWQQLAVRLGINKNVIFKGHVSHERKLELLSKCSALVLPSFVEGLPLVPLEAFAMCKPVILADIESSHEIVDDGIDGFIIPHNDESKWAEKILFLLHNNRICEEMGRKGRIKVQKKFNLEANLDMMESLYSRITS